MGSGSKRKSNDHVRINVPASTNTAGGGAGADTGGEHADINQACPLAFKVKLLNEIASGLSVALAHGEMAVNGKTIGKLSAARMKQISFCMEHGIRYTAVTGKDDNGEWYVKFEQVVG